MSRWTQGRLTLQAPTRALAASAMSNRVMVKEGVPLNVCGLSAETLVELDA